MQKIFQRTVWWLLLLCSHSLSFILPEDIDECQPGRCHQDAVCYNTQGSFTCQCRPGYYGDGFYCSPGKSLSDKQIQNLKQCFAVSWFYIKSGNTQSAREQMHFFCCGSSDSFVWCSSCRLSSRKMKNGSFSFTAGFISLGNKPITKVYWCQLGPVFHFLLYS